LTVVNREFEDEINAVDSTEDNVNNLDASDASVEYNQNDFSDGEIEFNTDPALDEHAVDAPSESQTNIHLNIVLLKVYGFF